MEGFDLSTASGIYLGGGEISALYLGSSLIWPTNFQEEYLTITSMNSAWGLPDNDNIIKFVASDPFCVRQIQVSTDKVNWTTYTSSVDGTQIGSLKRGRKLYIRGYNSSYAEGEDYYNRIVPQGEFAVSGNIMSLIDYNNFREMDTLTDPYALAFLFKDTPLTDASNLYLPATTLSAFCYMGMFENSRITKSPKELPATTLAEGCYWNMFRYCGYLDVIPETLPATVMEDLCYGSMFQDCVNIKTAPKLPALTLADYCYELMFWNCYNLEVAPVLPATTMAEGCYKGMFGVCTSLVYPPQLPALTLANNCYDTMFSGCTSLNVNSGYRLPATTLAQECYYSMFEDCTSITNAPLLPATTLATRCYKWMFHNCSSLNNIAMFATDDQIYTKDALGEWVFGVSPSGTFIKAVEQTTIHPNDVSGIPRGWVTEDRYVISIVNNVGGNLTVSRPYAVQGQRVTVGYKPNEGYDFDYITVEDSEGNPVQVNYMTFIMPASSVTITGYWVTYESMYLTIESLESGNTIYWKTDSTGQYTDAIQWSFNKTNWTSVYSTVSGAALEVVNNGDRLYLKGNMTIGESYFVSTGPFRVFGNAKSLVAGDDFETSSTSLRDMLAGIFKNCTHLTDASNIVLPDTVSGGCYRNMFEGCTSLVKGPKLPATSMTWTAYLGMFKGCTSLTEAPALPALVWSTAYSCYESMFEGCTSLVNPPTINIGCAISCFKWMFKDCTSLETAPVLPATTLYDNCYYGMFEGCTSLVKAPDLPAVELVTQCYYYMFDGCTSLNYIKMLGKRLRNNPGSTPAHFALNNWVRNVADSGRFYKSENMTELTIGDSGIPYNWVVTDLPAQYAVNIGNVQNGSVTPSVRRADYGDTVTLTLTPDTGYELYILSVTDRTGNQITVTNNQFTMPNSNVIVSAVFANIESMYFTIQSLADNNTISWSAYTGNDIQYSTDKINWTTVTAQPNTAVTITTLDMYDEIYVKGHISNRYHDNYFVPTGNHKVYGNVMSLTNGDNFTGITTITEPGLFRHLFYFDAWLIDASRLVLPATTLSDSCYQSMFYYCTSLTAAPQLPATTLATRCYQGMFYACRSLTNTQQTLPATTLAEGCYKRMYRDCDSLTIAPQLPATTLVKECYYEMFNNCDLLETAPTLPATTLAQECYAYMLTNCTSLNSITMLAKDISAYNALKVWAGNVAALGTFTKPISMTSLPTGEDGIPTGWTVVDIPGQYTITIGQMTNGTVTCISSADAGDTVTLTVTPSSGYELDTLSVVDSSSNPVTVTNNQFTMPASNVTVSATFIQSYNSQYLTIESQSANNVISWVAANTNTRSIQYSTDKTNWNTVTSSTSGTEIATLGNGDKLYLKGSYYPYNSSSWNSFASTGNFKVYGNIMSLTNRDNFDTVTTISSQYQFYRLFNNCSYLTNAAKLILPATTLTNECYSCMFYGCTSLTTAPELPATTLRIRCYQYMFANCTSLTTAPILPAKLYVISAYVYMFDGCTSLNSINCQLNAPAGITVGTTNWVRNVAATGTFTKNDDSSWSTGNSGIPSGWTVITVVDPYTITIGTSQHGTVSANATADAGDIVKLSATPDSGYELDSYTVLDSNDNPITVLNNQFTMPASNVTVTATFKISYGEVYLTIESLENNNAIGWKSNDSTTHAIEWSTDNGQTWNTAMSSTSGTSLTTLNTGDKLYIKGTNNTYGATWNTWSCFTSTKTFNVYGNIMSMIYGDNFANTDAPNYNCMFWRMFQNSKVVDASNLKLPATVRSLMFTNMFYQCTSLTTAPELPNSANYQSHNGMFKGCTSLTTAPVITANPGQYSYRSMFENCTSLNSVTVYATSLGSSAFDNWLNNVSATGTFTKLASMTSFPSGGSGIPSGWTVVDVQSA